MTDAPTPSTPAARARSAALRFAGLLLVWLVVTEGNTDTLLVGIVVAAGATAVSRTLLPGSLPGVAVPGLLRYVGFFAFRSVAGGIDVATRALSLRMPLDPGFISYPLRLTDGPPRVLFAHTVSLLPGTVSVRFGPQSLEIHALDCGPDLHTEIALVEERVAGVFGIALPARAEVHR